MASGNGTSLLSGYEREREALDAVLSSRVFSKSPRLAALLEYLCVRHMKGDGDAIKEYHIAVDVFGRPADFDQSTDAIVRVEIHRLRKKLQQYYEGEGAGQTVRIVIQPGRYAPEFAGIEKHEGELAPAGGASVVQSPAPGNRLWAAAMVLLVCGVGIGGLAWRWRVGAPGMLNAREVVTAAKVGGAAAVVRILCGSQAPMERDRDGRAWSADEYFSGGTAVASPVSMLYRTRDYRLYGWSRRGEFSYRIPLRPGIYQMRLYFADTSFSPGVTLEGGESTRVFQVSMNGAPLLKDFDIIADSGPGTADVRVFKDVSPAADGYLHLKFARTISEPLLNAIEIAPGQPHRLLPVRIVTQDERYTDSSGNVWLPDDYYLFGRLTARTGIVRGTRDPELYAFERYGNFSYAIPVDKGSYGLTLYFAESYFGPLSAGGGGAGNRIFDVSCNETPLLRNFDMFQTAGSRTAITRTFHGMKPNAQGKLMVAFTPSENYASVSAIEVLDETP